MPMNAERVAREAKAGLFAQFRISGSVSSTGCEGEATSKLLFIQYVVVWRGGRRGDVVENKGNPSISFDLEFPRLATVLVGLGIRSSLVARTITLSGVSSTQSLNSPGCNQFSTEQSRFLFLQPPRLHPTADTPRLPTIHLRNDAILFPESIQNRIDSHLNDFPIGATLANLVQILRAESPFVPTDVPYELSEILGRVDDEELSDEFEIDEVLGDLRLAEGGDEVVVRVEIGDELESSVGRNHDSFQLFEQNSTNEAGQCRRCDSS